MNFVGEKKYILIAVNSVRVVLAAASLCADRLASPAIVLSREDEQHLLDTIQRALRLHAHARAILLDCAGPLASDWFLSPPQVHAVIEAFGTVVGGGCDSDAAPAAPSRAPTSPQRPVVQPFQQGVHLVLAAVAQGMPALEALRLFAQLAWMKLPNCLSRSQRVAVGFGGVHSYISRDLYRHL